MKCTFPPDGFFAVQAVPWGGVAVGVHAGADLTAAHAREHHVEEGEVVRAAGRREVRAAVAVVRDLDRVSVGGQAAPQGFGEALLAFDREDAHAPKRHISRHNVQRWVMIRTSAGPGFRGSGA